MPSARSAKPAHALLVLNKIDRLSDKRLLLPLMERTTAFSLSARRFRWPHALGEGLETLKQAIVKHLPAGPAFFRPTI